MSPRYLVMCAFGQNIWFLFLHNLIQSNVWGPSKVATSSGKRWFVTSIDNHTRLTWVYLITDKSEVYSIFQNFYYTIETQFHKKLLFFRVTMAENSKIITLVNF